MHLLIFCLQLLFFIRIRNARFSHFRIFAFDFSFSQEKEFSQNFRKFLNLKNIFNKKNNERFLIQNKFIFVTSLVRTYFPVSPKEQENSDVDPRLPFFRHPTHTRTIDCGRILAGDEAYTSQVVASRVVHVEMDERHLPMDCDSVRRRHYFPLKAASKAERRFPIAFSRAVFRVHFIVWFLIKRMLRYIFDFYKIIRFLMKREHHFVEICANLWSYILNIFKFCIIFSGLFAAGRRSGGPVRAAESLLFCDWRKSGFSVPRASARAGRLLSEHLCDASGVWNEQLRTQHVCVRFGMYDGAQRPAKTVEIPNHATGFLHSYNIIAIKVVSFASTPNFILGCQI